MSRQTIAAMVTPVVTRAMPAQSGYRYCPVPRCSVVYYDDAGTAVERTDVSVPVSAKALGLDVPLCYCFGYTRRAII